MKCENCPYAFAIESMTSRENTDVCLLQIDKGENFQPVNYEYDHPFEGWSVEAGRHVGILRKCEANASFL